MIRVTFVGNATVLLEWGPFTVLTDPSFLHAGQRAYLGYGLVSKRLLEPALTMSELPPLDLVVLSHLRGDHWDRVVRRGLDRSMPIVTTPHAARRLQGVHRFHRAVGLRTWETHTLTKAGATLRVASMPGMHAPGLAGRVLPPVMGSLLELGDTSGEVERRVYVTGDTLMYDGVREIARRFPVVDVAVVHLGGTTLPGGRVVTMDGGQGADLLEVIRPRVAVPVHFDDYTAFKSPLPDFVGEVTRRGLGGQVRMLARGESAPVDWP
jgi:L-ascorbate metabolism protein UlaG (beta-lactamase superfamily)